MNRSTTIKKVQYCKAYVTSFITGLACMIIGRAEAQSVGFVQQDVVKISGITTSSQLTGLSAAQKKTTRSYYNGLSQTIQTVNIKASPNQKDIIQPYAYDVFGQQTTNYLPYVGSDGSGSYHPNALTSEQSTFYTNGLSDKVADDSIPYSQATVEFTPLRRLLTAGGIGTGFQPGQHAKTFNYRSNSSADGNIIIWGPDGSKLGNYAAGALTVNEMTNEDTVKFAGFADFAGRTVLKRQFTTTAGVYLDTYYIYNNAGAVSFIVPPKAIALMTTSGVYSLTQSAINKLIFQYVYDNMGRLVQKTVPTAGTVNMVYDPLNRLVLAQDANMATSYKWYYIKYDGKDHTVSSGVYVDPNHYTRSAMQTAVSGNTVYNTYWFETRITASSTGYYSNNTFPSSGITPLVYTYFDNYDLDMSGTNDYSKTDQGLTNEVSQATDSLRGVMTMVRKTTIGGGISPGTWLTTINFYDSRGHVIQTKSNNQITTAISDVKTVGLDFMGAPVQSKVVKVTGSTTTTVLTTLGYDPGHRVSTIDQNYNGGSTIRIASYFYNELGQPVDKKLHSTDGGVNFMQSLDYRYNIRGQLLSINNSKLTSDTGNGSGYTNDDSNDLFGMQFLYEKVDANLGNTPYFSGRMSAVKWMNKDANNVSSYERAYNLAYDRLDRYTAANYKERTASGTGTFSNNVAGFSEYGITYDENGNINHLNRNTSTQGTNSNTQTDNLTYTYNSANPNQLQKISDAADGNAVRYGFQNFTGASSSATYNYDTNGNLIADPYKGLALTYNVLNRTDTIKVTTSANRYITYTYDATGMLLRKKQYDNNVLQNTTDYIDGFNYVNNTLAYFPMPEGRVRNTGTILKPEYIISDQQGNARMSFEESTTPGVAKVSQENSYYPSGLVLANSPVATPTTENKQLYNGGSEWQKDFSNMPDYYQTFYRNYDASIGRFIGSDPEPESAESMTPYNYSGNNPVMFNDPLGNSLKYNFDPSSPGFNQQVGDIWRENDVNWGFQQNYFGSGGGPTVSLSGFPLSETAQETLSNPYELRHLKGATTIDLSIDGDYYIDAHGNVTSYTWEPFTSIWPYQRQNGDPNTVMPSIQAVIGSAKKVVVEQKTADHGNNIDIFIPTFPWNINLGQNGNMYYTNITYYEDFIKLNRGFKFLTVYIKSINVAFSTLSSSNKNVDLTLAKSNLAFIINTVRIELDKKFNENSISNNKDASVFFLNRLNSLLNSWYSIGGANLLPVNNLNPLPLEHTGLYYPFP